MPSHLNLTGRLEALGCALGALGALTLLTTACVDSEPEPTTGDFQCEEGEKCDGNGPNTKLFQDPAYLYINQVKRSDGTIPGDFRSLLAGIGDQLGCDEASQKSYMVLSNHELSPKTIFTRCSTDPEKAASFFMVLGSAQHATDIDMDPDSIQFASWDATAGLYRTGLATKKGDGLKIKPSPAACLGCHGGVEDKKLTKWQPIMHVMTAPWSQWNAEPGFPSHLFNEFIPPSFRDGPLFKQFSAPGTIESASVFEPIVRAGIDRVVANRLKERRAPADIKQSLELLRPVFCDETANYVSEASATGVLKSSTLIDDGIRQMFFQVRPDNWPWGWLNDGNIQFSTIAPAGQALTMIPTRGESTVQYELGLVSRGALTAQQVLQVRALDWQRPVFSEFRCNLFRKGVVRVTKPGFTLRTLPADATNVEMIGALYDELMRQPDGTALLPAVAADHIVPLAVAGADALTTLRGTAPVTLQAFGDTLDAYAADVSAAPRGNFASERTRRACRLLAHAASPLVSGLVCPNSGQ